MDLLKVDCISDHPYKKDEIAIIRRAIDKTGRPMVSGLAGTDFAGPCGGGGGDGADVADLGRYLGYLEDGEKFPQSVTSQFARAAAWAKYVKPGNWPDADMLPLGELRPTPGHGVGRRTELTEDEQRTM